MDGNLKVKAFNCPKCGGTLSSRGMFQTASIVCGNCRSIIDISDENYRVLDTFNSKIKYTPLIPLGAKGALRGEIWQMLGVMRRCIMVEGVAYRWTEYLLFNPFKGFRWLTEYQGHWNYVRPCLERPRYHAGQNIEYRGATYKHFQTAKAEVDYVVGEFYWRVEAKDAAMVTDFVAPPFALSMEETGNEVTWSQGEYIPGDEVRAAFQLKTPLPPAVGVYANQPSPYARISRGVGVAVALLIGLLFAFQVVSVVTSQNKRVYSQSFLFNPQAAEKAVVTDLFNLEGRRSNVVVESFADVNNNWIFLNMSLINDDTGVAYEVGREISYYSGADADGSWSEGSRLDRVSIPSVPAGHYYLRIEPESAASPTIGLIVYRDVPRWGPFLTALVALVIGPVIIWCLSLFFENKRWAESDHPWTQSSGSESDSDDD